jgi:ribosomal protection tetracycline resistance protein
LLRRTLNLGIVAHVDAGKTTLTERLLHAAGVIDEVGSVDKGTTQTDSLPLEQQRGITIKAAVVSFELGDVTINLIDTPGHPDFIAEVERVLSVLDGAVLVVSAVEGVQPQTRILMRALRRLRIPTLIFVNKLDRLGADFDRTVAAISERLTPAVVVTHSLESRADAAVEVLAENDEALLAAYVDDAASVTARMLRHALAAQTRQALVHPVFSGAAITGEGVEALSAGLVELLPSAVGDPTGPVSGTVFKIERGAGGEKLAYVRMFSGTVRTRDVVHFGPDEAKVTAISVFDRGGAHRRPAVSGRQIAKLAGLREVEIGSTIGEVPPRAPRREFPPPTLQSVVVPRNPDDGQQLRVALEQLAEQDPLINVRQEGSEHKLTISLYGEVQKEVIEATLASDFGLDVAFRETTPIYVERPVATGQGLEVLHGDTNPHLATIGLRIAPAPAESGIAFRLEVDTRTVPLYVYKTRDSFAAHMDGYVRDALREGLFGWQVTDCVVTMNECGYSVPDGPPSRRGPLSTAADFRKLTPQVARQALEQARTVVCEPTVRVALEVPTSALGSVFPALIRLGAEVETPSPRGTLTTIDAVLPVTRADELQRQLAGLTGGEGVLESTFAGYQPVSGEQPLRRRVLVSGCRDGQAGSRRQ